MLSTRTREIMLRFVFWGTLLAAILLLIVAPLLTSVLIHRGLHGASLMKWLRTVESWQIVMLRGLTLTWLFVVGSCFASFLNVVAWRVPRGKTITGSSHCPNCDHRLAFGDNLPIVGWWRNAGRCRNCQAPIAIRYLVAEIVLGTVFLILGATAFMTGGANWPLFEVRNLVGFEHLLFSPDYQLISILVWHLTLLGFLFTFMLIESDNLTIPKSVFGFAILLACVVPFVWPEVWLVQWYAPRSQAPADWGGKDYLLNFASGLFGGLLVGWLVKFGTSSGNSVSSAPYSLALVGLFLGWQAALGVGVITLFTCLLLQIGRNISGAVRPTAAAASTLFATVFYVLIWRFLYSGLS